MLVNQPKWTLNGVISVGVFATPKWRDSTNFKPYMALVINKPKSYPKWHINQLFCTNDAAFQARGDWCSKLIPFMSK